MFSEIEQKGAFDNKKVRVDKAKPRGDKEGHVLIKAGSHIMAPGCNPAAFKAIDIPIIKKGAEREMNETTGTILPVPTDKPINLDINAFLSDTQRGKKDLDLINDVIHM